MKNWLHRDKSIDFTYTKSNCNKTENTFPVVNLIARIKWVDKGLAIFFFFLFLHYRFPWGHAFNMNIYQSPSHNDSLHKSALMNPLQEQTGAVFISRHVSHAQHTHTHSLAFSYTPISPFHQPLTPKKTSPVSRQIAVMCASFLCWRMAEVS